MPRNVIPASLVQILANVKRVRVGGAVLLDSDRPMIRGPEHFDARRAGARRPSAESSEQIDCSSHQPSLLDRVQPRSGGYGMRKTFKSLKGLVKHLKWLAATGMLVVSMGTPVFEIASTVQTAYGVALMVEAHPAWFGKGPYWVTSGPHDHWEDAPLGELVYSGFAVAFTFEARLVRGGHLLGGHLALLSGLSDFEFLSRPDRDVDPNGMVSTVLIKLPSSPSELVKLRDVLLEDATCFAINDGSGEIHSGNFHMGNGIKIRRDT